MNVLNKFFKKIYVISLESIDGHENPRRQDFVKRFPELEFEFFNAIDGSLVDKDYFINKGSKLTRGQIGCAVSHLEIYKKIINGSEDKVLILEDDAIPTSFFPWFEEIINQLPPDWKAFFPGWCGHYNPDVAPNLAVLNSKTVYSGSFHCTHAMAIDKDWAFRLLSKNEERLHQTADGCINEVIRDDGLIAFLPCPVLLSQDGSESMVGRFCN